MKLGLPVATMRRQVNTPSIGREDRQSHSSTRQGADRGERQASYSAPDLVALLDAHSRTRQGTALRAMNCLSNKAFNKEDSP